jgi:hypothetical protein
MTKNTQDVSKRDDTHLPILRRFTTVKPLLSKVLYGKKDSFSGKSVVLYIFNMFFISLKAKLVIYPNAESRVLVHLIRSLGKPNAKIIKSFD